MAIPGSVPKSRWIAAAALVVLVIAAGAGWLLFGTPAKPPQAAAAPPPAPAVGVRLAAMKGVSQSFEFVGRVKAIEKVDLRARVEGFLEKVLFREGQDVKTGELLYQIEKVQFQAAVDQAKANLAVAEAALTNAKVEYERSLELVKRNFTPAEPGRPEQGRAGQRHGPGDAGQGRADAGPGQPRLHRHPRADRRAHRADRLHGRQSRQSGERRARDHRQPGSDLRVVPGERARPRGDPRGAAQGGGRHGQDRHPRPPAQWPGICAARRLESHRSAGRPADRFARSCGRPSPIPTAP